VSTSLNMNKMY